MHNAYIYINISFLKVNQEDQVSAGTLLQKQSIIHLHFGNAAPVQMVVLVSIQARWCQTQIYSKGKANIWRGTASHHLPGVKDWMVSNLATSVSTWYIPGPEKWVKPSLGSQDHLRRSFKHNSSLYLILLTTITKLCLFLYFLFPLPTSSTTANSFGLYSIKQKFVAFTIYHAIRVSFDHFHCSLHNSQPGRKILKKDANSHKTKTTSSTGTTAATTNTTNIGTATTSAAAITTTVTILQAFTVVLPMVLPSSVLLGVKEQREPGFY